MSLIEILVVLCIISVLVGLGTPALSSVMRGRELNQSVLVLTEQLALARQIALSTNRQIEVRLYKYTDSQVPAVDGPTVRAIQLFEVPESLTVGGGKLVYRPVSKFIRLPGSSIIIDGGKTLSTLIGGASASGTVPTESSGGELGYSIPAVETNYTAYRFSYMPDGSTNLPPQTVQSHWFLTVHEAQKGDNLSAPPVNFATLQIQPTNGKILTYHP